MKRTFRLLLASAALSVAAGVCHPLSAQPSDRSQAESNASPVSLSAAQLSSFDTAIRALQQKTGFTFLVEGVPLQPKLGKEEAAMLKETALTAPKAVEKVASLYDYDARKATKSDDTVWILTKRYTDPRDLPQVTTGEIVAFLQDAQRLMSSFNPKVPGFIDPQGRVHPTDPHIADFAPSLTPEQLQLLRENALTVASLSSEQKQMVQRFASHLYVQFSLVDIDNALLGWKQAADASILMGEWDGERVLGLGGMDRYKRAYFAPLQVAARTQLSIEGNRETLAELEVLTPGDTKAGTATQTLKEVVETLNNRGGSSLTFKVEPMLADKPVLLIGADNQPPLKILNCIADMYGLRLRRNTERGEMWFARRVGVAPLDGAGLADAVLSAVPAPLSRAAQIKPLVFAPEVLPPAPHLPDGGKNLTPDELDRIMGEHFKKNGRLPAKAV